MAGNVIQVLTQLNSGSEEAGGMSQKEVLDMMKLLKPYCKNLPGTPMYIAEKRREFLSALTDPHVCDNGEFTWFNTQTPKDDKDPILYTNLAQTMNEGNRLSWNDAVLVESELSDKDRSQLLRMHPALASRIFVAKQSAIFQCILKGKASPLGGEVADFLDRTEFQRGGALLFSHHSEVLSLHVALQPTLSHPLTSRPSFSPYAYTLRAAPIAPFYPTQSLAVPCHHIP